MYTPMELTDVIARGIANTLFWTVLVNSVVGFIVSYRTLTRSPLPSGEIREGIRFIVFHHVMFLGLVVLLVKGFTLNPPEFMPLVLPSICAIPALHLANKIARSFSYRVVDSIVLRELIHAHYKTPD